RAPARLRGASGARGACDGQRRRLRARRRSGDRRAGGARGDGVRHAGGGPRRGRPVGDGGWRLRHRSALRPRRRMGRRHRGTVAPGGAHAARGAAQGSPARLVARAGASAAPLCRADHTANSGGPGRLARRRRRMNAPERLRDLAPDRLAMSVTLHDVAPATQARCEQLIARLERIAPMALTLLVVPYYHGQHTSAAFDDWLDARVQRGDELALHGLTHHDDAPAPQGWVDRLRRRWYTAGEGEFAALSTADATQRLNAGRRWFARRRWPLRGFVAPAWLLSDGAWQALRRQPFDYTCTRSAL